MNGCTITTITGHCDIWQEYKHSVRYTEVIKQAIHLNTQVYAQQILMQCQLKSLHAFRVKIWNKLYIKSNQLDVFVTIEKQHKNTILSMHRNSNYPILIKVTWITHTMTKTNKRKTQKIVCFACMLRLGVLHVLCVCFCTSHFVMVPLNLTCLHCFQHSFFEHLFNLYYQIIRTLVGLNHTKFDNIKKTIVIRIFLSWSVVQIGVSYRE